MDAAVLRDEERALENRHIFERIAGDGDQVGDEAGSDLAEVRFAPQERRGPRGGRLQRLDVNQVQIALRLPGAKSAG